MQLLLLTLPVLTSQHAFRKPVVELSARSWKRQIEDRNDTTVWFVMFHGSKCPACRLAYEPYQKAADNADGMIKFGHVDTGLNYHLARKYRVNEIPTFYIFHPKGQTLYNGYRETRNFVNSAAKYIPNKSEPMTEDDYGEINKNVLLFTDKDVVPPLWAAISCRLFKNKMGINVRHTNKKPLHKFYNITSQPTVLVTDGLKTRAYEGKFKINQIMNFIDAFFSGKLPEPTPRPQKGQNTVSVLTSNDQLKNACRKGKYCVVATASEVTSEYQKIANKYIRDPFLFFITPEDGPLNFIRSGAFIYHRKDDTGFKVKTIDELTVELDRVIDGTLKFTRVPELSESL